MSLYPVNLTITLMPQPMKRLLKDRMTAVGKNKTDESEVQLLNQARHSLKGCRSVQIRQVCIKHNMSLMIDASSRGVMLYVIWRGVMSTGFPWELGKNRCIVGWGKERLP